MTEEGTMDPRAVEPLSLSLITIRNRVSPLHSIVILTRLILWIVIGAFLFGFGSAFSAAEVEPASSSNWGWASHRLNSWLDQLKQHTESMSYALPFLHTHFLYLTGWCPLNTFPEVGNLQGALFTPVNRMDWMNLKSFWFVCFVFLTRKTEKFEHAFTGDG